MSFVINQCAHPPISRTCNHYITNFECSALHENRRHNTFTLIQFCLNYNAIGCAIWVDDTNDERVRIVIKSAGIASEDGTAKPYEYFESRPEGEATEYVESVIRDPGDAEDMREETERLRREKMSPLSKAIWSWADVELTD